MSTYRSRAADQRAAEDVVAGQDLMCCANGCPHRWSVDAGAGKLCSWHAWVEPHRWPQITQERMDAMAERAMHAQRKEQAPPLRSMPHAEKLAILRGLRDATAAVKPTGRSGWARAILARSKAGERITPLILRMAQEVASRLKARREQA